MPFVAPWFWFIGFFMLIPLLYIEEYHRKKRAKQIFEFFWYAYLFFVSMNITACCWIGIASVSGLMLVVVLNSFFMALVFWFFHFSARLVTEKTGYYLLVFFWISYEFIHHRWELEWPWLVLGNIFSGYEKIIQWYEFTGVLGGSLWILWVNILMYQLFKSLKNRHQRLIIFRITGLMLLIFGPVILSFHIFSEMDSQGKKMHVVVVQPDFDPYNEKFGGLSAEEQLSIIMKLAGEYATKETKLITGPETAVVKTLWQDSLNNSALIKEIKNFMQNYKNAKLLIKITPTEINKRFWMSISSSSTILFACALFQPIQKDQYKPDR